MRRLTLDWIRDFKIPDWIYCMSSQRQRITHNTNALLATAAVLLGKNIIQLTALYTFESHLQTHLRGDHLHGQKTYI